MFSNTDFIYMQRALAVAAQSMYITTPNPRVGCVLVKNGIVIGEGSTQSAGEDHAEIQALKNAHARGCNPAGATAYISLEPCSHFGRTQPCTSALIDARIAQVIAAMEDPNPQVSGRGLAMLRAANIDVRCGLLANEAHELNIGFVSRMTRQRPWVRVKVAASLDGGTALPTGKSQWITSDAARADGHAWRARACAILTGIGTVIQDDPQLTVRAVDTRRQPLRVLVDSRLEVPLTARLLDGIDGLSPLIVCASPDNLQCPKAQVLRERGIEVIALPRSTSLTSANTLRAAIDLPALLRELAKRGVNELHVEAGHALNGALWQAECVDEWLVYLAPCLLGEAMRMLKLAAPPTLDTHLLLFHSVERIGDDLRIIARAKIHSKYSKHSKN